VKTIIVWFRSELRVHDHPALALALSEADYVVPLFIFNEGLINGAHSSSNRNRFLLECLEDLKESLNKVGADLVLRSGKAETELSKLAKETSAEAVYYTADYTPYSIKRDKSVAKAMDSIGVGFRFLPGRLAVSSLQKIRTKAGTPHKVFTPFWKQWLGVGRRELAKTPKSIKLPPKIEIGELPKIDSLVIKSELSPKVLKGGEKKARQQLKKFLDSGIENYHQGNNDLSTPTSLLSPYLHFGCLSPREIETMLPDNKGARAWHRQLCWREFYNNIIFNFPDTLHEFQEKYRELKWGNDKKLLEAWKNGQTGYPAVDVGMRQLLLEGWMHNRARLIVGSFLTKDLWLDWRLGETHFMHWLLDGDEANNNGNWQWIASVGVDPAPVYRRLYNPSSQRAKFDPDGIYVRRYVKELKDVPNKYLSEPWTMPEDIQKESKCIIGKDYPKPIIDHKEARLVALDNYRQINR
jgi:deoxyribodipyrimidine photo-lyase